MTETAILALGLAVGADWRLVGMAAGALWAPLPTTLALAATLAVSRRLGIATGAGNEVRFVEGVVGELRAGASVRAALRSACAARDDCRQIVRRLDVGAPLGACVDGLAGRLPTIGALVEAAVQVGAGGGRVLPVFEELVVFASAEEQARAELRMATAQVRASLWVLVGGPIAYLAWSVATGRFLALMSLPGGAAVAAVGAFLFILGVAAMAWMGRR
jgi:Flp pilus assembly protein TadB